MKPRHQMYGFPGTCEDGEQSDALSSEVPVFEYY